MTVEGNCVLWGMRVIIPDKWRKKVLNEVHRDHPGICKMKHFARSYIWWPGINKDIESFVKSYTDYLAVRPAVAPLHPWAWPSRLHMDFVGPFQGVTLLVVIDAFSKWPEVFVMQGTSTSKTIELLCHMVGYPEQTVTDNGPQFVSEEFATFMQSCMV